MAKHGNNPTPNGRQTLLMVAVQMMSKKPKYYRSFFDKTYLVSGSMDTLPKAATKGKKAVPPEQQYREINDEITDEILTTLQSADNTNNLLILDDVIKDITNSKRLSHVFLNRRHITHNEEKEGSSGLAIMIISQVCTLLPYHHIHSHVHARYIICYPYSLERHATMRSFLSQKIRKRYFHFTHPRECGVLMWCIGTFYTGGANVRFRARGR